MSKTYPVKTSVKIVLRNDRHSDYDFRSENGASRDNRGEAQYYNWYKRNSIRHNRYRLPMLLGHDRLLVAVTNSIASS
jgi:hypothetical protein